MKLHNDPDFKTLVTRVAEHNDLPQQFVEKDYYLTEILRVVEAQFPGQFVFRGGTSLTKGWKIVQRFSEDIDLVMVDPRGEAANRTAAKKLFDSINQSTRLASAEGRSSPEQRSATYEYKSLFPPLQGTSPTVTVDVASIAGTEPSESLSMSSLIADYATDIGLEAEDCESFEMKLLHYKRTFIEKLFAIHSYVEVWRQGGEFKDPMVRHYADLYLLSKKPEVIEMLEGNEDDKIKQDYDQKSRAAKRTNYLPPENFSFRNSPALFPNDEAKQFLGPKYEHQCDILFNSEYPSFDEVLARFKELRVHL